MNRRQRAGPGCSDILLDRLNRAGASSSSMTPRNSRTMACASAWALFLLCPVMGLAKSGWLSRVWRSDDGLPNNNISAIAQTPDGYLWLATPNHLVRFDGDQFEEFEQKEFAFNYKQRITLIIGGHDGTLWLPLDHGPVVRLSHGTAQSFSNDVPDLVVETAIEDDEGNLWISYRGGRLCRIRDGKVYNFSTKENFPENSGGCYLAKDNHGQVWIAKTGQVAIYRNGRFETVLPAQSAATRLAGARDGGMWMCSGRDFFKCDEKGNLKKLGSLESEQPGSIVTTLIEDRSGAVWIGSSASGLYRYDGARIESIPTSYRHIL